MLEIIISILVIGILLYLFYLYLEWCNKYSATKTLYSYNPELLLDTDKEIIDRYGVVILPEHLADTFKPIRFWLLYYQAKITA